MLRCFGIPRQAGERATRKLNTGRYPSIDETGIFFPFLILFHQGSSSGEGRQMDSNSGGSLIYSNAKVLEALLDQPRILPLTLRTSRGLPGDSLQSAGVR